MNKAAHSTFEKEIDDDGSNKDIKNQQANNQVSIDQSLSQNRQEKRQSFQPPLIYMIEDDQPDGRLSQETQQGFLYPLQDMTDKRFRGKRQLMAYLNQNDQFTYKVVSLTPRKRILVKCSVEKCNSEIGIFWDLKDSCFKVKKVNNKHNHIRSPEQSLCKITEILDHVKKNEVKCLQQTEGHKIQQGSAGIMRVKRKYTTRFRPQKVPQSRQQYQKYLTQNKITYWEYQAGNQVQDLPQALLFYNKRMKKDYKKYGDCLRIEYVKVYLKLQQRKSSNRQMLLFTGFNESNTVKIFAGALLTIQKSQHLYQKVFEAFFKHMGKIPESIITPLNNDIGQTLLYMKERHDLPYFHLVDPNSWMRQQQKQVKVKSSAFYKFRRANFSKLFLSRNKEEVSYALAEADKLMMSQIAQTYKIWCEYISPAYCPRVFYGLQIGVPGSRFWSEKIGRKLGTNSTILSAIKFVCEIHRLQHEEQQIFISSEEVTKGYQDKFVEKVRVRLHQRIFKIFLKEYNGSLGLTNAKRTGFNTYLFEEGVIVKQNKCNCGFKQHTGLPCSHLLSVLKREKRAYLSFIQPRWLLDENLKVDQEHEKQQIQIDISAYGSDSMPDDLDNESEPEMGGNYEEYYCDVKDSSEEEMFAKSDSNEQLGGEND